MEKKTVVKRKRRGRPATGQLPLIGFRASWALRDDVADWAGAQRDRPSLSEAIRRLVRRGLRREADDQYYRH